jgi:hypothetical protein
LLVTVEVPDTQHPAVESQPAEPFDLDAAMAALPPPSGWVAEPVVSDVGQAGSRLSSRYTTSIPDDLLEEMAKLSLGAERCRATYLAALRVVLGNQARAERYGYLLEMNQRVDFATAKTMRNIIEQMRATPHTFGKVVALGLGRSQEVRCFVSRENRLGSLEERLERMYRREEGQGPYTADIHPGLHDDELHRFAPP